MREVQYQREFQFSNAQTQQRTNSDEKNRQTRDANVAKQNTADIAATPCFEQNTQNREADPHTICMHQCQKQFECSKLSPPTSVTQESAEAVSASSAAAETTDVEEVSPETTSGSGSSRSGARSSSCVASPSAGTGAGAAAAEGRVK